MTFLQPLILWGLPLVLVPVVIHLLNRLRHRPMPWAAMMFLRSATRKSTRYARLRQFLVLLFRALAVLGLILAVSRPLAGGWMGWLSGTAPDTILLLLDRSASMEAVGADGLQSKRDQALKTWVRSAQTLAPASRLVLIENLLQDPQEIAPAEALIDHPRTELTDTAADLPSLLQSALDWVVRNQPGSVELWIASDLQRSNWQPDHDRWPAVVSGLAALPQSVRVRLLGLNRPWDGNTSITTRAVTRRPRGEGSELEVVLEIQRSRAQVATVPVTLVLDGVATRLDIDMEGSALLYRHRIPLEKNASYGWGKVSLSADVNPADNVSYFVYGPPVDMRAAVLAEDAYVEQVLQLATVPNPKQTNRICDRILPGQESKIPWDTYSLLLWQRSPPQDETARRLQRYVQGGGVVVFFPSGSPAAWNGIGWGALEEATAEAGFAMGQWEEESGPFSNTEEGLRLPLQELQVKRRQPIHGSGRALAWFDDGVPLWTRQSAGRGQVHCCATLPHPRWSRLQEGDVLVPLVQRLFEEGGQRFSQALRIECGEAWPSPEPGYWSAVDPPGADRLQARAGVFRAGSLWLAIERPLREDDPEQVDPEELDQLFAGLPFQRFEEEQSGPASLPSELWRGFLVAMLMFLLAEAVLILPERPGAPQMAALRQSARQSNPGSASRQTPLRKHDSLEIHR